jgi:hypothetical protein
LKRNLEEILGLAAKFEEYVGLGEKSRRNPWPQKEILKNTWASERNPEEYLGLREKF